jgi:hypothetical protein
MEPRKRVHDALRPRWPATGVGAGRLFFLAVPRGLVVFFALAAAPASGGASPVPESPAKTPSPAASSSASAAAHDSGTPSAPALAQAQQAPLLARPSAEEVKVRELLRLTGSVNVGLQMRDRILDTFKKTMPQVPADVWEGFRAEADPRELEDAVVPLYLASFTAGELDEMLAFYHSPVGEKLLRKQPEIFRASNDAGRKWATDLTYRLRARLTEKGFPPPGAPGGDAAPASGSKP